MDSGHRISAEPAAVSEETTTVFGRLRALALLRDPQSLSYRDMAVPAGANSGSKATDPARVHLETLWEWLSLGLEAQKRDLEMWLDSDAGEPVSQFAEAYELAISGRMLSPDAVAAECQHFTREFDLITGLLLGDLAHRTLCAGTQLNHGPLR